MAQYCAVLDVQNRFPTVTTELPALVNGYVTLSSGEIDGDLSAAHFIVPITGTVPEFVKELCILMSGTKLENILYERENSKVDGGYIEDLQRLINDMRSAIRSGKVPFALPRISGLAIISVGDALQSPTYSQHELDPDLTLVSEDMND